MTHPTDAENVMLTIGSDWTPCVKLPITVHVRSQRKDETHSSTREGIAPLRPDDLIMRGVQGEEYPIGRQLFEQTYRLGSPRRPTDAELAALLMDTANFTSNIRMELYASFSDLGMKLLSRHIDRARAAADQLQPQEQP
jgi:hypothetical protein